MHFDVASNLAAVRRTVTYLEREGNPALAVTLSRIFETSLADLWDATTTAERIPRWFLPVSGELAQGGRFQLEGNAGGEVTACVRHSGFSLTWEFAGDVSWVDVEFSDNGPDGVRLTLTHTSNLSDFWTEYGPGAVGVGWETGLLGLDMHIAQPSAPKPDVVEFVTSEDGRSLIMGSSEEWANAAIAAGGEPVAAQAAARRTTAFYTGESLDET